MPNISQKEGCFYRKVWQVGKKLKWGSGMKGSMISQQLRVCVTLELVHSRRRCQGDATGSLKFWGSGRGDTLKHSLVNEHVFPSWWMETSSSAHHLWGEEWESGGCVWPCHSYTRSHLCLLPKSFEKGSVFGKKLFPKHKRMGGGRGGGGWNRCSLGSQDWGTVPIVHWCSCIEDKGTLGKALRGNRIGSYGEFWDQTSSPMSASCLLSAGNL